MLSSILTLALFIGVGAQDLVETCEEFQEAVDRTADGDVEVLMYPFADIFCSNFTTFTISGGNSLTVMSSENLENFFGSSSFENARFEVLDGSELTIENNVFFFGDESNLPDVNGGSVFVGPNSKVRFLNDFSARDVGVRSVTVEDSDFSDHENSGGVIYNEGIFVVDGISEFDNCENSGGGESSPGPGGCAYNDGYMLFRGSVEMNDVSIIDDEGNNGAGIYNSGTVRINGDSRFTRMFAESGGVIFNTGGSTFVFGNGASVVFSESRASDGSGGIVSNNGFMKFTGPSLFLSGSSDNEGGAIYIGSEGVMNLARDTVFFGSESLDVTGAPVYVRSGGVLNYNIMRTYFFSNFGRESSNCPSVYDEIIDECI